MQRQLTITATGTTQEIIVNENERLTFGAIGDVGDYAAAMQVQLTDGGNWFTAEAAITDGQVYSTISGARKVRFDVTSMGTATSIQFEVTGADL